MRRWIITGLGVLLGSAVGAVIYMLINPWVEARGGAIEELQGLLWNIVPLLTIVGGILGWRASAHRPR